MAHPNAYGATTRPSSFEEHVDASWHSTCSRHELNASADDTADYSNRLCRPLSRTKNCMFCPSSENRCSTRSGQLHPWHLKSHAALNRTWCLQVSAAQTNISLRLSFFASNLPNESTLPGFSRETCLLLVSPLFHDDLPFCASPLTPIERSSTYCSRWRTVLPDTLFLLLLVIRLGNSQTSSFHFLAHTPPPTSRIFSGPRNQVSAHAKTPSGIDRFFG